MLMTCMGEEGEGLKCKTEIINCLQLTVNRSWNKEEKTSLTSGICRSMCIKSCKMLNKKQ